jgi:hypothetical protein
MTTRNERRVALCERARGVVEIVRRPGCTLWACQLDTLILALVREVEHELVGFVADDGQGGLFGSERNEDERPSDD